MVRFFFSHPAKQFTWRPYQKPSSLTYIEMANIYAMENALHFSLSVSYRIYRLHLGALILIQIVGRLNWVVE